MGTTSIKGILALIGFFLLPAAVWAQAVNEDYLIQQVDSANTISFQYITTHTEKVRASLLETAQLAESINYKAGLALTYKHLALAYYYQGKYEESTAYHINSIKLYEELGMVKEAALQYSGYGYQIKRRNLDDAEMFLRKGIHMSESIRDTSALLDAYGWYGVIKEFRQQLDSALYYYEIEHKLKMIKKDTLGMSYSLSKIGGAYFQMRQYDLAVQYLNQAYAMSEVANDSISMAINQHNTSYIYIAQQKYDEAINVLKRSLAISLSTNYVDLSRANYEFLATTFETAGKLDSALFYHKIYTQYKDSLLNENTNKTLAELEVQFKTEQKERELAQKQAELAEARLKTKQRNFVLIILSGFIVCGIIIAWMYYRQQRIKQRNLLKENELRLQLARAETENRVHEERERISRDLHDNVGAQITNLIAGIEISNLHIKNNQPEHALSLLSNLDTNAREVMSELRETIWLLSKSNIMFSDFTDRLRQYLSRQEPYLHGLKTEVLKRTEIDFELNPFQSLHMLRIIQESLNNSRKYAQARLFSITFNVKENQLLVSCTDDGKGASPQQIKNGGNGLKNIERRVEELSGTLQIRTRAEEGFHIFFRFPLMHSPVQSSQITERAMPDTGS